MKTFSENTFNFATFVDVLFNFLLVFIVIITLVRIKKDDQEPSVSQNVMYQLLMDWNGESATDMDLWARDATGRIVGFNNREGGENSLFSLAHDDLGSRNDVIDPKNKSVVVKVNQEIISLRGTKEGEYVANVHCYRKDEKDTAPITVTCRLVKIKPFKEIIKIERVIKLTGDEETFFRFSFNKDGEIVSTNELPQKFVSLNKGGESAEATPSSSITPSSPILPNQPPMSLGPNPLLPPP